MKHVTESNVRLMLETIRDDYEAHTHTGDPIAQVSYDDLLDAPHYIAGTNVTITAGTGDNAGKQLINASGGADWEITDTDPGVGTALATGKIVFVYED
jgi:hypothetical protein